MGQAGWMGDRKASAPDSGPRRHRSPRRSRQRRAPTLQRCLPRAFPCPIRNHFGSGEPTGHPRLFCRVVARNARMPRLSPGGGHATSRCGSTISKNVQRAFGRTETTRLFERPRMAVSRPPGAVLAPGDSFAAKPERGYDLFRTTFSKTRRNKDSTDKVERREKSLLRTGSLAATVVAPDSDDTASSQENNYIKLIHIILD